MCPSIRHAAVSSMRSGGCPSWGFLTRFKKTKGPCFWTISSQILCTIAIRCLLPLCAVFREGGLTQTTMEQHFFHCQASTINDHRDIFKYCSLRFDAPPSSCTRAMPCHAQAVCAVSASLPGATAAMSSAGPAPFCRAGAGRCWGTAWRTAWNAHCFILPAFQWVNRWLFVVLVVAGWAACWLLFLTRRFCLRRVRPRQAQHARQLLCPY